MARASLTISAFSVFAAVLAATVAPASARMRDHRRAAGSQTSAPRAATTRAGDTFYPNDIEGGVHGNLPFNNQLRKLSDPLNAAGAGR